MLESHVAELLATYLSRFIENVSADQLQVSLWSGNVVLNNVRLRSDVLESITALLNGEQSSREENGGAASSSTALDTSSASSDAPEGGSFKHTFSVRMLLAPFTVVKGVIRQLVITVPWASLESEAVRVQFVGVELVLGPLRARAFNAQEEQQREQAIKQQQLHRYDKDRQRLSREATEETASQVSSIMTASTEARHLEGGAKPVTADASGAFGASWFSWLLDVDRMSQIALRNVSLTLQDISVRYEFDYDGLHPSCASALGVFVQQIQLTTTNETFEDVFNKDLLAPLCKRIVLSDVVVSTHAVRRTVHCARSSASEREDGLTPTAAGESAARATAYDLYRLHWAHSTAIVRVEKLELRAKVVPPGCASRNAIVEDAPILSASSTELTVAAADNIEVDMCFGVVQVLESMRRSYHQSLPCARYRKRLHLLRPTERHATHHALLGQASTSGFGCPTREGAAASRPSARQRWSFALRCVLDDVHQHHKTFGLHGQRRSEVVQAMVQFGHLRRTYVEYWKRTKGAFWAPPLTAVEAKKLQSMERQLPLWQVVFLRCLANAQLLVEQDGYARQRAFIEEARQRTKKGGLSIVGTAGGGRSTASLWGWLFGSSAQAKEDAVTRPSTPSPSTTSRGGTGAKSVPVHGGPSLCDMLAVEWDFGRRYASPHSPPLLRPTPPHNHLSTLAEENKLYFTLRVRFATLIIRVDPNYWPLRHDSSVPDSPSATPLRHVRQHLAIRTRSVELFYTTIPDDRPGKASLSFFIGSASIAFEGVLRSVLLQSKEQFREDFVVVKRNSQCTHIGVWVAPQLVIFQPMHEWSWWYTEISAFAEWFRMVQQVHYASGTADASPCALSALAEGAPFDLRSAATVSGRTTASCSGTSTPRFQPSRTAATTASRGTPAPPIVCLTIQALDVCVPLFARDIESSDLEIFSHQPSAFSSAALGGSLRDTLTPESYSRCSKWHWRLSTEAVPGSGDMTHGRPDGATNLQSSKGAPSAPPVRKKSGVPCVAAQSDTDEYDCADSLHSSHGGSLSVFANATPARYFLNNESCLVLSVSTTRLWTVAPGMKRYKGAENEYYLCIGDHSKAVRLFCQKDGNANMLNTGQQLELLSFVAGEVLFNPKELTVLFNKGINAVADPAAFALVNDALLKPTVFTDADADGQAVRAVAAELQQAAYRQSTTQKSVVPWHFRSSTSVELQPEMGSAPVVREVPQGCARHIMSALSATFFVTPSSATSVAGPASNTVLATGVFGDRVVTVGMGMAHLLIRSEDNVDLAELVLVAPEKLPSATTPYREALAALGAEEPRAIELMCDLADSHLDTLDQPCCDELPLDPPRTVAYPRFLLSIPDITMTTAAGRKLLNVENLTLVKSPSTSKKSEVVLTIQTLSAFCDLVLVQLLEVLIGTVRSLRPMTLPPQAAAYDLMGTSRTEGVDLAMPHRFSGVHPFTARVQTTRVQIPLSRDDVMNAPYVEVTASIGDVLYTLDLFSDDTGRGGRRVYLHLIVLEAMHLVDYVGGDPEVRSLISAPPWTASSSEDDARHPLRCEVEVMLPGTPLEGTEASASTRMAAPPTCRVTVVGGALHVYFPFLYFLAATLETDERIVRLGELAQSPLLRRGYTHARCLADGNRGARVFGGASPSREEAPLPFSVEVNVSDLNALLATDAAVPIDLSKQDTFSVVHLERIVCGMWQAPSDSPATSTTSGTRAHAYVHTSGVRLLDSFTASRDVCLPNVKVRAEMGALLVLKDDLTGYECQLGAPDDWMLLVGVHPGTESSSHRAATVHNVASSTASDSCDVVVHLSAQQCHRLCRFFLSNFAQPPIPSSRRRALSGGVHLRHVLGAHSTVTVPMGAGLAPSSAHHDAQALGRIEAPLSPAVTVLLTIPSLSLVVDADDSIARDMSARRPTVRKLSKEDEAKSTVALPRPPSPSTHQVSYEVLLRRGGHMYSAAGGRWFRSPVKSGQVDGAELVAREVVRESLAEHTGTTEGGRTHLLLTVDVVRVALIEECAWTAPGQVDDYASDEADAVKVSAVLQNPHLRVPHIKWWLHLYRMLTGASLTDVGGQGTAAYAQGLSGTDGNATSFRDVVQHGHGCISGQGSSSSGGHLLTSRGGYVDEDKAALSRRQGHLAWRQHASRRFHGTFEMLHAQASLFVVGSTSGKQQPWCQLTVSEAKVTASPISSVCECGCEHTENAESPSYTFVLEVPRCPELLLRLLSHEADSADRLESKHSPGSCYASVLRRPPAQAPDREPGAPDVKSSCCRQAAAAVAHSNEALLSLRLLCSSEAGSSKALQCGRSYYATDLTLYRTSAVQVRLQHVLLELPAIPLFFLLREVLRQAEEVQSVQEMKPLSQTLLRDGQCGESMAREYMGIEVELTDAEVRLLAGPTPGDDLSAICDAGSGPVSWSVAVGSFRLTTSVELHNVFTSTRDAATLIGDELSSEWRVRVWHMIPQLAVHGVVLSTTSGTQAQWPLPDVHIKASLPLMGKVLCVRPQRATGADDEVEHSLTHDGRALRKGFSSTADLFQVEPTVATAFSELHYHVLASLRVDAGSEGDDAAGEAPGPAAPVQVCLPTVFTLASAAARLVALWRQTQRPCELRVEAAVESRATGSNAGWWPYGAQDCLGLLTWYELELYFPGHRLEVAVDTPAAMAGDAITSALEPDSVVCVSVGGAITVEVRREDTEEGGGEVKMQGIVQNGGEEGKEESVSGIADASVAEAVVRTLFRLRTGPLLVHDGAGSLLLHVSETNESAMTGTLIAEYAPAEARLHVIVGRVAMHASYLTAASMVRLWRAYRAWGQKWESTAMCVPQPATRVDETKSECEWVTRGENSGQSGWLQSLTTEVRLTELLLAPAARLCVRQAHMTFSPADWEAEVGTAAALEVRCEEACLHSMMTYSGAPGASASTVLARTCSPVLVITRAQRQALALEYRTPLVSVMNSDAHSWAMCALRAANVLTGIVTAMNAGADVTSQHETASATLAEGCVPWWVMWIPRAEIDVRKAELLCFAPSNGCTCFTPPAVCLVARQVALRLGDSARTGDCDDVKRRIGVELSISAELFATYRSGVLTDAHAHSLLGDVITTFALSSEPALNTVEVTFSAAAAAGQSAVSFYVPTGDALANTVAALALLARAEVPRRYGQAGVASRSLVSRAEGRRRGGALWHVRVDVPGVLLHCVVAEGVFPFSASTASTLYSIRIGEIHAEMCTRRGTGEGGAREPFMEVWVSSAVGETVVTEAADATGDRFGSMPWKFFELRPATESCSACPPSIVSATGEAMGTRGSSSSGSAGLSLVQRSLSLPQGGEECGRAAPYCTADETTALVVRLHALHAHPSLTLLQLLTERVLRPCVTGISTALSADAGAAHILEGLKCTVLRVDRATAVLPTSRSVNRRAGQVRVIEVVTDWDLCDDLRLGGEDGFQLHFRGTAGRSVITVRGGGSAGGNKDHGNAATIFLGLPVSANGEVNPAIRVDPDLTARFENISVILGEEPLARRQDAFVLEAFVELGERSLCLLPSPFASANASPAPTATGTALQGAEASTSLDPGDTVVNTAGLLKPISWFWAMSVMRSVDVAVGFDVSLTAGARRLAATGAAAARYRFEEKRHSQRTLRSEHEGEFTVTLHRCISESGPLTACPVAATAYFSFTAGENRLRVVLNGGSTAWRLPLGHAHVLMGVGRLVQRALYHAPSPPPPQSSWPPQATSGSLPHEATRRPTPVNARAEVPSWALTLTSDAGSILAVLIVERVCLQCSTDVDLADAALTAEAIVCLRDCVEPDDEPDGPQNAVALYATRKSSTALHMTAKGGRVLFSAHPRVSVSSSRFCPGSRSLSVSVHIDDVVATLPTAAAARLLQRLTREMDAGMLVFCNESGVEMEVTEAESNAMASDSGVSRWHLPAEPGRLVSTTIPVSCAVLMLTPVERPAGGACGMAARKSDKCTEGVALSIQAVCGGSVCRVSLPGYDSALGALDLVVRKSVLEGVEVLHLTTAVALANGFYAGTADGRRRAPAAASAVSVTADSARLAVPPRSGRYIPLPLLRECLALELHGCAYTPVAKMLTWAMLADAMTAVADQAASFGDGGSGGARESGTASGFMVYGNLYAHGTETAENGNERGSELRAPALCSRVRALDACTVSFPMLLSPVTSARESSLRMERTADSSSGATLGVASESQSQVSAPDAEGGSGIGRVVQLTWRRLCSRQGMPLFTGRLVPSEYIVAVEPVWTLWNWTGCRLRLRLRTFRDGAAGSPLKTPYRMSSSPPTPLAGGSTSSDIVASAEVENGMCFQWTPATLDVLRETVFAFFLLRAPSLGDDATASPNWPASSQWWSVAAPLSLQEPPPSYMRLQQGNGTTRGALRVEQRGPSNIVLRCAALLRSGLARPVYLRDADQPQPLLGAGAHGCVMPQQQVPLFYSEYATTFAPKADRVGFKLSDRPVASAAVAQETEAYYLTSPIVAKLLSACDLSDRTHFYTVSNVPDARVEPAAGIQGVRCGEGAGEESVPASVLSCLWTPEPAAVVQLRSLCRIRNTDLGRTLLVMPYDASAEGDVQGAKPAPLMVTPVPPGEEREVTEFSPHAKEPEVQFCYTTSGSLALAHTWSPPVRLLSLSTLTQPLVLKHACIPPHFQGGGADASAEELPFAMSPVRRRSGAPVELPVDHFRCLTVQSRMTSASLCVSVGLQAMPPVKIVNRLNTTLLFAQCALATDSDFASPPSRSGTVSTALCSRAACPRSYVVEAESVSYGCWEVPTQDTPGLRLTLFSNVRKGLSVSDDVDLLRCAASPSSGTRIGNTDAYVYVSLDHRLQQYTVTVAPTRRLESRMLFQPRRLTQVEVYVRSCIVYVAAITVPTAGPFARKSLLALGARGRMRLRCGARSGEGADYDTVPLHATDEDVLSLLKEEELDVVLVRLLGFYGSTTVTERHLMGSASLALLEVVDCTMVEAAYPVLLRVGPRASSVSVSAEGGTNGGERGAKGERGSGSAAIVPDSSGDTTASEPSTSVPHLKDPSWFSVEVQLSRPEGAAAGDGVVILPVPELRITVPPIVVRTDDDFLFTVRSTAERLSEEWASATPGLAVEDAGERRDILATTRAAVLGDAMTRTSRCRYSIFVYVLQVSPIAVEVTYTRCGHRHYSPFEGLARIAENLIPSVEGLSVSLREVHLRQVELRSSNSLFGIARSFLWPLYRTQLLLQSYKVVGSLDALGNPRALLGSWSRGVWELLRNSAGQSRWAGTREFLRTTTSSTLHSVGVVARSIGNLVGAPPPTVTHCVSHASCPTSASEGAVLSATPRRGVLGEVLHAVGGGISDAVTKPIRGARESGLSGFLVGIAAGVIGLAGRPIFGFFRGVSATSEFYARLLGGLGELTEVEARRVGLERNYRVVLTSTTGALVSREMEGVKGDSSSAAAETPRHGLARAPPRRFLYLLTHAMYDRVFADIPRWRRGDEANVRLAVDRVGICNTALHIPYASLCAFFSPSEFRAALPCALTALLASKLIRLLSRNGTAGACRAAVSGGKGSGKAHGEYHTGEGQAPWTQQTHECARALYIKSSLGVRALRTHVTDQVFVCVCSLAEVEAFLTATEEQRKYSVALARAMGAAGEHLLAP
ncbi:hypothetical protein LSCM1_00146 [Leishmania martiniquensis]|uniref:Uncharacterized protein n=1 Tax=Leishmania martiniquensis TaxID=1580590 RepID=A0A836KAR3_9TRYP|nr:hypothetical protein LSCM1_00146 [Leishmania martiniquensis]